MGVDAGRIPGSIGPRWVEIDLDAIAHNVREVKKLLEPETRLMAVVKADAYGCGATGVAAAVLQAGAEMLGVTTLDEALELREHGIEAPVVIFAPLAVEEVRAAEAAGGLHLTVGGSPSLHSVFDCVQQLPGLHVKVDTGMNRIGFRPEEVESAFAAISQRGFTVQGLYTHFATSGATGRAFLEKQFETFMSVVSSLEDAGYEIPLKHVCSSAATLEMPRMHLDMVRVGTLLYGQYPFGYEGKLDLKDPWRVRARLVQVKDVPAGESVGYGRDFRAGKPTRVGILPLGFADGLGIGPHFKPKSLLDLLRMLVKTIMSYLGVNAGAPVVTINGRPARILGRIGMQLTAVDLTGSSEVSEGDTASVFLHRTAASARIPRVYVSEGAVKGIRTPEQLRLPEKE